MYDKFVNPDKFRNSPIFNTIINNGECLHLGQFEAALWQAAKGTTMA